LEGISRVILNLMTRTTSASKLDLVSYVAFQRKESSVTELMKLCYLADLVSISKRGKTLSDFEYRRYNYGPFDESIYSCIETLVWDKKLNPKASYTITGDEYLVYEYSAEMSPELKTLKEEDTRIIDETLQDLAGYGAKALTDIAYKTKPMIALNATRGGKEALNEVLNLEAK
jgi:uncharacterized phage-associated protein